MAESCEDYRPLFDTLIPATEFMTREEVIETLKRVCAAFDQKTLDSIAARVHHEHVEKNLQRELELTKSDNTALKDSLAAKECLLAEKDRELAARDEEIKSLKAELADSRHSEESLKAEKYAGRSKRGLGKSRSTSRGRDDNKDDFDGTPESAPQTDADEASEGGSGDDAPVSLTQIRKAKASRPSSFHCSHQGAGNDCVIRSFIETCRLRGISVTGWFKAYFNAILNGRTDYSNLLPGVLAID